MDTPYFHNKGIVEAFKAGIYYLCHFVLFVFISVSLKYIGKMKVITLLDERTYLTLAVI